MSFWLKNVGTFLEKLDGQAEKVAEETNHQQLPLELLKRGRVAFGGAAAASEKTGDDDDDLDDDDDVGAAAEQDNLESVLAARGLVDKNNADALNEDAVQEEEEEEEEEDVEEEDVDEEDDDVKVSAGENNDDIAEDNAKVVVTGGDVHHHEDDEDAFAETLQHEVDEEDQKEEAAATPGATLGGDSAFTTPRQDDDIAAPPPPADAETDETKGEPTTTTSGDDETTKQPPEQPLERSAAAEGEDSSNMDFDASPAKAAQANANESKREPLAASHMTPKTAFSNAFATATAMMTTPTPKKSPQTVESAASAATANTNTTTTTTNSTPNQKAMAATLKEFKLKLRESQKESRTLRRHVLSLNTQLEASENEMNAQRRELENAAVQMEKERAARKLEREKDKQSQADEIKKLKQQHETAMQLMRQQLNDMEQQRQREGGNLHTELAESVARERETLQRLAATEDEKDTLLHQIMTLNNQQEALGNRLESLTNTVENAMQREREAEQRLDEALSAHARQITQRQARESELEKTISELGAALVAARNSGNTGRSPTTPTGIRSSERSSAEGTTSDNEATTATMAASFASRELFRQEIETLTSQLLHEQQRNAALHAELREMTREHTEEASIAQSRQIHHDRHVAELSATIARLKAQLQEAHHDSVVRQSGGSDSLFSSSLLGGGTKHHHHGGSGGDGVDEDAKQIKTLSEEVLRLREKITTYSSELSALKNRLRAANDRAERAEVALEDALQNGGGNSTDDDVERGGARRRTAGPMSGGGGGGFKRRVKQAPTLRSALRMEGLQSEKGERIGKTLDALDAFLIESGKFLRYHPVARLLFIVYFLLIHLWTFVLLFFHAHGYETLHGDFGGQSFLPPSGPDSLLQQHSLALLKAAGAAAKPEGIASDHETGH